MNLTVEHVTDPKQIQFFWYDYLTFSAILGVSTSIGIYYGCFGSKQGTVNKYLMGGKKMTAFPIALSIAVGHFSSITLTAIPTDIYKFGAYYVVSCVSVVLVTTVMIYLYLIVFFKLQITSTYEYLEMRFDKRTRLLGSFLWILIELFPLSIALYTPSLALSAATGLGVNTIAIVTCAICIFYTTIGGLRTVVWTDIYQLTLVIGSLTIITILGVTSAGGISVVLNRAIEGGRFDIFDLALDPTKRDGIWLNLVGIALHWATTLTISQSVVQKLLALPSFKECIRSVLYLTLVLEVVIFFVISLGLLLYEKYADCDPLLGKKIQKLEQMVPYYVLDIGGSIPGVAGLFLVALCCASLSSISSSLNALSGVIYKDFLSKFMSRPSEKKTVFILKVIVVICGIFLICLVTQIENMGDIFPLAVNFQSLAGGSLLGMFTLGVVFPRANAKGAFYSAIISLIWMASIIIPTTFFYKKIKLPSKSLSVEGCFDLDETFKSSFRNYSGISTFAENVNLPPLMFRLSHFCNTAMGLIVTIIFGLIISYCTNKNDPPVDEDLISPIGHYFLRRKLKNKATAPLMEKSAN